MKIVLDGVRRFLREEEGANGVEYALLAGLIAIAFITGASFLGNKLNVFLNAVGTCVGTPNTTNCGNIS